MQIRRQARIAALQTLFEIDAVHHSVDVVLQRRREDLELPVEAAEFARFVVHGVLNHREQLDEMIIRALTYWQLLPPERRDYDRAKATFMALY